MIVNRWVILASYMTISRWDILSSYITVSRWDILVKLYDSELVGHIGQIGRAHV